MTKPPSTLDAYLKKRLVPREPGVPELSAEDMRLVETTVFVKPDPLPSDLLFIFGSSNNDWQFVADLYRRV